MNTYLAQPLERKRALCEQAGASADLVPTSVEKDFWVSWILWKLFNLPRWGGVLTFKGGTSLSKCWKLIERFSEDIDIVIDREALGFSGDKAPHLAPSNKAIKRQFKALSAAASQCVQEQIQPALRSAIAADIPDVSAWTLESDPDDSEHQTLLFKYPSALESPPAYLRPAVKIEMGARSDTDPSASVEIRPILHEQLSGEFPDAPVQVRSVLPERTFWEKACLLHEENFRPPEKPRKGNLSRHYYDVYRILASGRTLDSPENVALFDRVVAHRRDYFGQNWMDYNTLAVGHLNMFPKAETMPYWRGDYAAMRDEMFYGDIPKFAAVLERILQFQNAFNARMT